MSDKQIDGYYYDSSKNRYFRIDSRVNHNPVTKHEICQKNAIEKTKTLLKSDSIVCVPKSVFCGEIGHNQRFTLPEEVMRSQLKSLTVSKTIKMDSIDFRGDYMERAYCDYLIATPSNDTLYPVICSDSGSAVYRVNIGDIFADEYEFHNRNIRLYNCYPPGNRVIDITAVNCSETDPSLPNLFATLTNHYNDYEHSSLSIDFVSDGEDDYRLNLQRQTYEFNELLDSLGANNSGKFVIGGEKKVYILNCRDLEHSKTIKTDSKVTALRFTIDGNVFIMGTHNGKICCCDMRESNIITKKPLIKLSCIKYIHLLNDGNRFVLSCFDDKLVQFDLRMITKPILVYSGHKNSGKKIPLSVDETCDIMCSVGTDSIIRFWSLYSGKILHMIPPVEISTGGTALMKFFNSGHDRHLNHLWYSHSWKCLNNMPKPLIFNFSNDKLYVLTKEIF